MNIYTFKDGLADKNKAIMWNGRKYCAGIKWLVKVFNLLSVRHLTGGR